MEQTGAVKREATFKRGSDPRFVVLPDADYRDEISWVEDADPVEIQGGDDEIGGQLANIGSRNDGLTDPFRFVCLDNCPLLTTMRTFPSRLSSDGE